MLVAFALWAGDLSAAPKARGTTVAEVAAWVPRVVLAPVWFVTEVLLRRPLGALVTLAERRRWPAKVRRVVTWGPNGASGIVPAALVDFGFRPSVGVYLFSDDWLYRNNGLRLHLATGGASWLRASAAFRHHLVRDRLRGDTRSLELRVEAETRPDRLFWGLGPRAPESNRSRYEAQFFDALLAFRTTAWRRSHFSAEVGVRARRFLDVAGEVASASADGRFLVPSGFVGGYTLARVGLSGVFDTRSRRRRTLPPESDDVDPSETGIRIAARAELAAGPSIDPAGQGRTQFLHYGMKFAAYVDVWRHRVVAAKFTGEFVEPLSAAAHRVSTVPFTELPELGGSHALRGFLPGRLLGPSALAAVVEYRWPIWLWLDGVAHYGVGNVFDARLGGASVGALRQSFGLGIRSTSEDEHGFELLLAAGTKPLDEGGAPESLRFVLGSALEF
jgi:hypothetical protein